MTEKEAKEAIKDIPVGSKLQLIMKNGDIVEVVLASQDTAAVEKKDYDSVVVPALLPAIIVQGKRWGTYRIETSDIVKIARIG
ncbi:hypothetical protein E1176_11390 [Fulvivirga sp. RKSG066]|uniref:hypothetical protein n=1 Tax=Fulvivirga aurantia TaxID=2529383 RepID=UPI0012BBA031|nr:hypothetical protein [Fulvivirga aurantia]MTI21624.1 hypothetical protein [Fulvivirga aurantia]